MNKIQKPFIFVVSLTALMSFGLPTWAANAANTKSTSASQKDSKDAIERVRESQKVVQQMESDPQLKKYMQQARGLFIIPKYARAGLGVAGRGGAGIALMKQGNNWSDPAFYYIGGLSAGLQGGVEAGPIAFILNNEKAVQGFHQNNNFSLNADSGLTVINWNAKASASAGQGDVIAWSGTKGLFGNVAVGITDIKFDKDETAALYGKQVAAADIFSGKIKASSQQVADLKKALPSPTLSGGASSQSPSNESQPNQ